MADAQTPRPKTGGRTKGTPNKATAELKKFLDGVFAEAFADEAFRASLLLKIKLWELDTKLLIRLLEYWAGAPAKTVDHTHKGKLTLEQLVAGVTVDDEDEDGE